MPGTIGGLTRAVADEARAGARAVYTQLSASSPIQAILTSVPTPTLSLGGAENVAILGASTVTNTGPSVISGDVALTPGSSITGFPPGSIVNGSIHINDGVAILAHADALAAYTVLAGEAPTANLTGMDLGGLTLTPGIYKFDSSAQLTGALTLNTLGDPNAVFHFQIGSTLTVASGSSITLLNGNCVELFWQVGSSATIGTSSVFRGTIIASQSITLNTGAILEGRALALNGAVTLDDNTVTLPPACATPTPSPTATPVPTATPSPGPTATPSPGPTATPSPGPTATPSPGPTATPILDA